MVSDPVKEMQTRQCNCQELSSEALSILLGIDADHVKLILGEATEEKKGEICQTWRDCQKHGTEMTKELDELFANLCQQHKVAPVTPKVTEKEARYGFLQLSEAEYGEAVESNRYPEPKRYGELTSYFPEPHEPGWKGLSLAEMFPTKYKGLLQRGVPDQLSPSEVKTVIEEKRIPYGRGVELGISELTPIKPKYRLVIGEQTRARTDVPAADIAKILGEVPDVKDTGEINYWIDIPGGKVYLEGWSDKCIAGWGYPERSEGEYAYETFFEVGERLSPEIIERKARESGLELVEGGFIGTPEHKKLFGITYGVYRELAPGKER